MSEGSRSRPLRSGPFALLLFLAAGVLVRCGGDSGADGGSSSGGGGLTVGGKDPCTSVYAGLCGGVCTVSADCAAGLYCSAEGVCTAQCGPGASLCSDNQTCASDGQCVAGSSTGGTTGLDLDAATGSGGDNGSAGGAAVDACAAIDLELGDTTPTVVLLIDQSGSMSDSDIEPGGPKRWDALKTALISAGSVLEQLEAKVRFGVVFYSNADGDHPPATSVCPVLDRGGVDESLMPPDLNRFDAIKTYYEPLGTYPNTPTGESIAIVADELFAFDEPGPKYIILATDGNPDRCEQNNENADDISKQLVVTNVGNAYTDSDITTFVISVGDDVAEQHLHDVANVGQGFPASDPMDRFFKVTTQDALTSAFEDIINGVRSCTLTLNGEIDPDQASKGKVLVDGEEVAMDPDNGWTVIDGQTIELVGTACDSIKSGDHTLSATFPCEAVVTPPIPK